MKWNSTAKSLEELKQEKLAELSRRCNQTIIGKFSFDYNGVTYYFSCDTEAQSNFEKVDRAFDKARMTEINWTSYDVGGNAVRLTFDKASFEGLYLAHLNHIQSNISKLRDVLMPIVLEATADELNAVTWDGEV